MGGEHVFKVRRHGVSPEEIVVQGIITVGPLGGIEDKQLVNEVQCIRVLHVGFQPVFNFSLLTFRQFQLLVQFILLNIRPNLKSSTSFISIKMKGLILTMSINIL